MLSFFVVVGVRALAKEWQGPKECIDRVLDSCCESFASALAVERDSLAQQERTMKRFAKQGSGSGANSNELTDMDKVYIQLCLDVETFLKESKPLRSTGATGNDSEQEAQLRQVIVPIKEIPAVSAYLSTL